MLPSRGTHLEVPAEQVKVAVRRVRRRELRLIDASERALAAVRERAPRVVRRAGRGAAADAGAEPERPDELRGTRRAQFHTDRPLKKRRLQSSSRREKAARDDLRGARGKAARLLRGRQRGSALVPRRRRRRRRRRELREVRGLDCDVREQRVVPERRRQPDLATV